VACLHWHMQNNGVVAESEWERGFEICSCVSLSKTLNPIASLQPGVYNVNGLPMFSGAKL
jgi:hypothetical protein